MKGKHKNKQKVETLEKPEKLSNSGISTPDGSVANKQANIKHLQKHYFQNRISLLDDLEPNSELNKNKLVGFYNMLYVVSFYYFIINPIMCYKNNGYWMETRLYDQLRRDLFMCIVTWPIVLLYSIIQFYLWSHVALLIQYLALYRMPKHLIFFI